MKIATIKTGLGSLALLPGLAMAAPAVADKADNAFMMISTALVLFMTIPGIALFYGGLIRGKNVREALAILRNTPKAASKVVEKTLRSAMANAENNNNMNIDNLYVSTTFVDAGPIMKRIHPRSRGQAFGIMKRTSTLTVKVSERN